MSEKYKVLGQDSPYFTTFAVEGWVDVFTRPMYKEIVLESLRFCQREKGLIVYAWCLMTNHIHLIVGRNKERSIDSIVRDFKKYTSVRVCKAIENNRLESRRDWILKNVFRSSGHYTYLYSEAGHVGQLYRYDHQDGVHIMYRD